MKVGIDLDNILNDLNFRWIQAYNLKHNDSLSLDDIQSWGIHKYTKNGRGIYSYLCCELFDTLKPLPNSIEVTERLAKKHELFIITASEPKEMVSKHKWLKKYFPHIPTDNIIICKRKDLINVELLVDDATHNVMSFPNKAIIMNYGWNQDAKRDGLYRVNNWLEIEKIVSKILRFDK